MTHDIVYILSNGIKTDEVLYSVRSVVKNFPYHEIWFYGGKPDGIEPDHYVAVNQTGTSKWDKVNNTLLEICQNDQITKDFWLFNDDFFIAKKIDDLPPMVMGTLAWRIQKIFDKRRLHTGYSKKLRETQAVLKDHNLDRLDYAVHCPMLINRAKGLETLKKFKGFPMFRSLYGNHHRIGGQITDDFKVFGIDDMPDKDQAIISTTDIAWRSGKVGEYIREMFKEPCKYE